MSDLQTISKATRLLLPQDQESIVLENWEAEREKALAEVSNWPAKAHEQYVLEGCELYIFDHVLKERGRNFEEPVFLSSNAPTFQDLLDILERAMNDEELLRHGFNLSIESRVDLDIHDDDGYKCDHEPTEVWAVYEVCTYAPVKATDETMRLAQAYQHFLFYIDLDHLKKNDPWSESGLFNHFVEKLQGYYKRDSSAGGPNLIDCDSIVKWVQEMTGHNQKALFDYIYKFHIDKY